MGLFGIALEILLVLVGGYIIKLAKGREAK